MGQVLSTAFAAFFGVLTLMACFVFINHLNLKRWKWFSDRLGRMQIPPPRHEKTLGLIVISDVPDRQLWSTGYHAYPPVTFGLHPEGLSLRIRKPFGLGSVPIMLPIAGLRVGRTSWPDLAGDFVAISHAIVPDAYIIAYDTIIDWAHEHDPRIPHPGPRAETGVIARRFGKSRPRHNAAQSVSKSA